MESLARGRRGATGIFWLAAGVTGFPGVGCLAGGLLPVGVLERFVGPA